MLWTELARITIPGLILGGILGKLLANRPHYLKLLNPRHWTERAKTVDSKQWIRILSLSIIFGGLSFFIGLLVRGIITPIWGPFLSSKNVFVELASLSLPLLIISITLLPILEEWIFRGIMLEEISRVLRSKWAGLLLSSLLFAVFHLSNPGTYTVAIVPYFAGGIIMGASYLAGGLAVAVLSHILYNLLPFLFLLW